MSCVTPLRAYRGVDGAIVFDVVRSLSRIPFLLPCGKCIGCRLEKARQWGIRCLHEAKMWPHNSYVTLTYSDDHLPPGGSLCLRDVQLFMKRLRKSREPDRVRFFLGGEYGEENRRPHYHALLFNCGFRDLVPIRKSGRGETLYTSSELSNLWSVDGETLGFCTVGSVTFDSAVYCAKYALKSLNVSERSSDEDKAKFEARYIVYDADGVVHERSKEFAVMSRRPGIGMPYYEKYGAEVRALDNIIVNGREVRPPRFYDSKSESINAVDMARFKRRRKRLAVLNKADNTADRLFVKKRLMEIMAEKKERKL